MKGDFLKKKIEDTGITAAEVAAALGITPQNLNSKFKSDTVKVDLLLDVARFLDKDLDYFLHDLPEAKGISLQYKENLYKVAEPAQTYKNTEGGLIGLFAEEVVKLLKPRLDAQDKNIKEVSDRISLKEEMEALKSEIKKRSAVLPKQEN